MLTHSCRWAFVTREAASSAGQSQRPEPNQSFGTKHGQLPRRAIATHVVCSFILAGNFAYIWRSRPHANNDKVANAPRADPLGVCLVEPGEHAAGYIAGHDATSHLRLHPARPSGAQMSELADKAGEAAGEAPRALVHRERAAQLQRRQDAFHARRVQGVRSQRRRDARDDRALPDARSGRTPRHVAQQPGRDHRCFAESAMRVAMSQSARVWVFAQHADGNSATVTSTPRKPTGTRMRATSAQRRERRGEVAAFPAELHGGPISALH